MLETIPGFLRIATAEEVGERWPPIPGYTIVVTDGFVSEGWQPSTGKQCVMRMPGGYARCGQPAVATLPRGHARWPYCADHLYGRRLVNGRLEVLIRVADDRLPQR